MIHLRSILAIVRKDALEIWLDRSKLAALLFPLVLALVWLVLGRLLAPQPAQPTTLLVYNPSQSPLEQTISGVFSSTQITAASSPTQVSAAFSATSASYDVGLVIPASFEASVRAGSKPVVGLYLNGNTQNKQQAAFLQAVISYYARTIATPTSPVSVVTASTIPAPKPTIPPPSLESSYANLVLPVSFAACLSLLPGLLIEEKEKKTLRMLMVSPASYVDVLLGKVIVVFIYQMALSLIVLGLFGAFSGNVPLVLLFTLCGVGLALSAGLLLGTVVETSGSVGGLVAIPVFAFIIPAIFVPLAPYMGGNAITQIIKILPTYYVADGVYNALQKQGSASGAAVDIAITLGCALVIFLVTLWLLRRQAEVAATI